MTINQTPNSQGIDQGIFVRAWRFLTEPSPAVEEVGERKRAQLLSALSLILTISFALTILSSPSTLTAFYILIFLTLLAYVFSRTEYYRIGAYFLSFGFTSLAYFSIYLGTVDSIDSSISSIVPISLILASVILSQGSFLLLAIATVITTLSLEAFADQKYLLDPELSLGRTYGIVISTAAVLYGITAFRSNVERARLKEVQVINSGLTELTANLEIHVNDRTSALEKANQQLSRRAAQLQTIAELSQTIAQMQNPGEIFSTAATLISERFSFYHVGIFLMDDQREFAILQAANSEGGKKMLDRGHRLLLGTGVVGFAAKTGKARIAPDVGADSVFFNNPDLPDTRSEVALPLISREKTIGVLDVQSTEAGAFTEEDLQVLSTLANQVAIALENASLLFEARASATQLQDVYNEFVRSEWSLASKNAEQAGFRYNSGRIEMLEFPVTDAGITSAVLTGRLVSNQANGSEEKRSSVAVPVKLRGEVIGILQIQSTDSSRTWQENELSLMEAVAERAALAMENARLFQDARRRAAKEKLISDATSRISGSLNIENILQTTAIELERVLGGSEVLIQFKNKDSV